MENKHKYRLTVSGKDKEISEYAKENLGYSGKIVALLLKHKTPAIEWIGHAETLYHLTQAFPEVWITLQGFGEDITDNWIEHAFRGTVKRGQVKLVLPAYSECKEINPGTFDFDE